MNDAKLNILKLPDFCYSRLLSDNSIIRINAGEQGYYPVDMIAPPGVNPRDKDSVDAFVNKVNAEMNITLAQRSAMEHGSMWGWELPLANPANWNEDGTPDKGRVLIRQRNLQK